MSAQHTDQSKYYENADTPGTTGTGTSTGKTPHRHFDTSIVFVHYSMAMSSNFSTTYHISAIQMSQKFRFVWLWVVVWMSMVYVIVFFYILFFFFLPFWWCLQDEQLFTVFVHLDRVWFGFRFVFIQKTSPNSIICYFYIHGNKWSLFLTLISLVLAKNESIERQRQWTILIMFLSSFHLVRLYKRNSG